MSTADSAEPSPGGAGRGLAAIAVLVAVVALLLAGATNLGRVSAAEADAAAPVYLDPTPSASPGAGPAATVAGTGSGVDARWLSRVAASTGIPERALAAYAHASLTTARTDPTCHLGWNTLAAIGWVESDHGRHAGSVLGADGRPSPVIRGPVLADGRTRAVGPMQFLPSTWSTWGTDANADGRAEADQIDDAALAAAGYLCAAGGNLATGTGWVAAVFAYNHSDDYVNLVRSVADQYAAAVR